MRITAKETEIQGNWTVVGGAVVADDTCRRIDLLKTNWLRRVDTDSSGWDVLYQDPHDGRYWELTYLQSEIHGGGPPTLRCIPENTAKSKYGKNIST